MTQEKDFLEFIPVNDLPLWEKRKQERSLISFDMELTARCNNNCGHCYINLPAGDKGAKAKELSSREIMNIVDEAVSLGALWCLLTGGEPLLREDFSEIYLGLKRKGLLISVFTNATLITEDHARLFTKYPPRDLEVTVYGVTEETYERVTRRAGTYKAFMKGLDLLLNSGVKVRLKAMALRSNAHEMPEISRFCKERSKDFFRFDPQLHLRLDRNPERNQEIRAERLSPAEVVDLEQSDKDRLNLLKKGCGRLILPEGSHGQCNHLFHCGAGVSSFSLGHDGTFRLCSSLVHPSTVYDLKKGTLSDAWNIFVLQVRAMCSHSEAFLDNCRACSLVNLCMWCPAHAYLETGELDSHIDAFCRIALKRKEMLSP